MKEAIKSSYFIRVKAVPLTLRAVRKKNIHLILITALRTCKQIFPARLSVKNMIHFTTVFRCFDCEYKCK